VSDRDAEPDDGSSNEERPRGVLLVVIDDLRRLQRVAPHGSTAEHVCERLLPMIEEALR
jgi:hypothetical protein